MSKQKGNTIKPLFDYVLIKPLLAEEVTPSGIVLPDSVKEKPQMGQVMAIGPGAHNTDGKLMPMFVKVGQKVMYKKWGGNEIKVGHEEWLLVEQKDVMAVVEN
ncbi:co-chaperone GroES [Candidatus Roizmanbacteria bacterium RIFOXYB2_FULL_38_10]|uniref:Co-chaperonin GroES n=1 Tax=Candidatus Roizmanbacteria bacterium RIFOXYD1_FULL_38_12 TaxID=1802093 RepID=A0A1F7KZG8_9BACT|nr:MAG: co-chaperone GroES [Candidatus Roizmanbacteria bacterium RIFOXYA2_FULL_38_14]OGK63276.1 MAG: co-chaperone GroES [Candidatus Roizmanbacteria bacterium RIFOXYA1_FULL_37_12]OGK65122.1 MAG: co-chaperone GroES [Candidatus Roizmanbacteria bacterium RIFOXYB1_FULL_40_23]OGK68677.1 MAG: co-chaperone GroES [Candidatus Roizmanbacteria bacterium RIFOXYB2_FULL_38_10]OGK69526.1 MAG: co-chaperone GroES [Candidatus Roizmanbacteria bacterium RIFOXYC1_FULL_38_14]OGK72681.1 MAG: co-chaperone GroES [Candi